jgi:hypothetical protein
MHSELYLENVRGKYHLEDLGIDWCVILNWVFKKNGGRMWTGLVWLRVTANGGLF